MLVLTRKQQQQIKIGDEITVTILRVRGNTVRVGIEAPRTVRVVRGELPPNGQEDAALEESAQEVTIVEGVVRLADDEATAAEDFAIARGGLATKAANAPEARPVAPLVSHLPQRRVLNRTGGAPLRVVMAGAVLAK
jgi:carbon storage regulator CsrA